MAGRSGKLPGECVMGKPGKSVKVVDWVALMDELWSSDDESPSTNQGLVLEEKVPASYSTCDPRESRPGLSSQTEENSFQHDTHAKRVEDASCLSEEPLNERCFGGSSSSQQPSRVRVPSVKLVQRSTCEASKTRQTDLLSFIDQNHSLSSTELLSDVHISGSTDDRYTTLENSRIDYTPQLSVPEMENQTKLPRVLFSNKSTKRRTRKRKASESIKTRKRSKLQGKENEEQLYLDLGQKEFGHVTCKVCGMIYTSGQPTDQVEHLHFHKNYLSGVNFPGWKNEHVLEMFPDGRIVMVLPSDPKLHLRKVDDIRRIVDFELGYASGASMPSKDYKVFLYISLKKRVMGCVIAEAIKQGYQVLTDSGKKDGNLTDISLASWLCSTDPQPAELGINRLWVSASCRRKGIASKLLNAARSSFKTGHFVPKTKVAFSDPTPDGRAFAANYSMTPNFLVYNWLTI